ncbi:MAG TPA: hypothetical protein VJA21_05665 [Verrucomicrobiae bacterium]
MGHPSKLSDGSIQFVFTSNPNGTNTVLATMDMASPLGTWTVLAVAPELSRGLFLFTDSQAGNKPR